MRLPGEDTGAAQPQGRAYMTAFKPASHPRIGASFQAEIPPLPLALMARPTGVREEELPKEPTGARDISMDDEEPSAFSEATKRARLEKQS